MEQTQGAIARREVDIEAQENAGVALAGAMPMSVSEYKARRDLIKAVVQDMVPDVHFGIIPGTRDRTLWEPGAEFLRQALNVQWDYEFTVKDEDHETFMYRYAVRAYQLVTGPTGEIVRAGGWEASGHSRERKFWCSKDCPRPCGADHEPKGMDPGDLWNNVKDRVIKRAFVNMIRNVTGTSGLFKTAVVDAAESANGQASKGNCPKHNVPFMHRVGTSKAGNPYDFWACPKKVGKDFCPEKPVDKAPENEPGPTDDEIEEGLADAALIAEAEAQEGAAEATEGAGQAALVE